ncbi:MAG: hypothetical protein V4622_05125, partial [Bacteroidota bacterium]
KNLSNLFVAFSKYEHFGLNTVILQNQNENDKFERIRIAIHYSLQGILICLNFLEITNERLQEINTNLSNKK